MPGSRSSGRSGRGLRDTLAHFNRAKGHLASSATISQALDPHILHVVGYSESDHVIALAVSDDMQDMGIERLADGRRRGQVSLGPVEIGRHAREPRPDLPEDGEPGIFQAFDQFPLRGHLGQIHRRRGFAGRVEHELGHIMPDALFFAL